MKCDKVCVLGRHFENSSNHGKYVMYGDIKLSAQLAFTNRSQTSVWKEHDGDSNENVKKAIGLHCNEQNNNFASA